MLYGRRLFNSFLVLLSLALLPVCTALAHDHEPTAQQGRLDFSQRLDRTIALRGEWGFAWQQFVDPAWEQLPAQAYATAPGSWNALGANGKPDGPNGWGSYLLQLNCPAGRSLAVEASHQRTASRLFVNGELVAAHGEPGTTAQASQAALQARTPISREFACPLRLTLHLSNFDHRVGGFVRPLRAGPADLLERQRESRIIYQAGLLSAHLLTAVLAFIFFVVHRRDRVALVFAFFCIAMAVYTDMLGERLLLRSWPGPIPWVTYTRIEYLSWITAMVLFFKTVRGLFPADIGSRVSQAVIGMLVAAGVGVALTPPAVFSYVVVPGQVIAVLVSAYLAATMLRASRRGREGSQVLLAGMLAVLLTFFIDLLLLGRAEAVPKLAPIGFALFLLSPAAVIAGRVSRALNAAERGRTLEENARLREDVERMSRHDLKTPLNSIVGVARLLREDARLSADQRALVGVLERASLRMTEMVNLSLGLFRMETGRYELRPVAVDLRQVTARVLVDLQGLAAPRSVVLHLEDADPSPVLVRGEELLCYSIVANLVKNAVEACHAGDRVAIRLTRGDPVMLSVHNPGAVPADIEDRFFDKYVTHGKRGGTGLGTYSARLMARAQKGELTLRTGAAIGTTLTLSLPASRANAPWKAPAASQAPATALSSWTPGSPARSVLLVDDDELNRFVTSQLLPSPSFAVTAAADGQAAVDAMSRHWPHFLLLDMEMPGMSGLDVLNWVREQEAIQGRPRCRVIMISGHDDGASAARALEAGAERFLVKPVSRDRLLSTLAELEADHALSP